jgi:hypothetical protein
LIFYLVQARLGFGALIFLFALLITFAFWFVWRRCHAHLFVTAFAILLGILSMSANVGVRTRVFTILLASIFLYVLDHFARSRQGKTVWILLPLMVLWVNLHGGFVIGLALIVLTMIGLVLDKWLGDDQIKLQPCLAILGLVFVGCTLAALVNPYGVQMFLIPIRVMQAPIYRQVIVDWFSPDFHSPEVFPFLLLFLLTTAAVALSPIRPRPSEVLFLLATLYATLTSQRNMTIFALVAVPLFANYSQHWLDSNQLVTFPVKSPWLERRANVLALLLLLPLILFAIQLKSTVYGEVQQQTMDVPLKAVEFLKSKQIVGNTFTDPNIWANYLIWAMPSNPVFIDGRDMYPEQFLREYVAIVSGQENWQEAFDRYGVQVVIVSPKSAMARKMKTTPGWEEVYQDEMSLVLSRRARSE